MSSCLLACTVTWQSSEEREGERGRPLLLLYSSTRSNFIFTDPVLSFLRMSTNYAHIIVDTNRQMKTRKSTRTTEREKERGIEGEREREREREKEVGVI